jgi:Ca2+-transporting ATPase
MPLDVSKIQGLSSQQVLLARNKYGQNLLSFKKESRFLGIVIALFKEPMLILLLVAIIIYTISGDFANGVFLAFAVVLIAAISLYQDSKSRGALEKLKSFSAPTCKVIRDGKIESIKTQDLVVGDYIMVEEGTMVPADATLLRGNDFSVDESILTGESMPVFKDVEGKDNQIFSGTNVSTGLAIAKVTAIGQSTKLGAIGNSLEQIKEEKTPLETQVNNFVKKMVIVGIIIFLLVWSINYLDSFQILDSLLKSLTLAMSIIPEEIPVAFTTFMALGAWRMMKDGILVKQMKTVETLGSATVICTDKTGTLTQNRMSLARAYLFETDENLPVDVNLSAGLAKLIEIAMWASEPIAFDPMEKAIHDAYCQFIKIDERANFSMYHEYPLDGKPPMMTHVFENSKRERIIAAKGAPEAIMAVSGLSVSEIQKIAQAVESLAKQGYRVLGVGTTLFDGDQFPAKQQDFKMEFLGLIAFNDPPKDNIEAVLKDFYAAGIKVKIITGDSAETTMAIAKMIGFKGYDSFISGEELIELTLEALKLAVRDNQIFTRMFPEAKLKIINALKADGEIVAMTGDGVNDGPALKSAHIGIAMGKKGTEIAKQAASLILLDDDLSKMVEAVAMGRKIYKNLKKAIQYIISIHIPIILTVFLPLALGWQYPNIFSPVHVIFLELIMGPTCSIIYENEPIEKNAMDQSPRKLSETFFNLKELIMSLVQGLVITLAVLLTYQYALRLGLGEALVRTMVFTVLIFSNIFLTLVNRSSVDYIFETFKYKNGLISIIIGITIVLTAIMLYVPLVTNFFQLHYLNFIQLLSCIVIGLLSIIWVEGFKYIKRRIGSNS